MAIHVCSTVKHQCLIIRARALFKSLPISNNNIDAFASSSNINAWPLCVWKQSLFFCLLPVVTQKLFTFEIKREKKIPEEESIRSCFIVVILRTSFCSYRANPLISLLCTHVTWCKPFLSVPISPLQANDFNNSNLS